MKACHVLFHDGIIKSLTSRPFVNYRCICLFIHQWFLGNIYFGHSRIDRGFDEVSQFTKRFVASYSQIGKPSTVSLCKRLVHEFRAAWSAKGSFVHCSSNKILIAVNAIFAKAFSYRAIVIRLGSFCIVQDFTVERVWIGPIQISLVKIKCIRIRFTTALKGSD